MSSNPPLISILLPIYNYSNIKPVVNSILDQDYQNFELLICDDGSDPPLEYFDFQECYCGKLRFSSIKEESDLVE